MLKNKFSRLFFPGFYFDADSGGAGGGGTGDGEKKPEAKFSQEDVDRMVAEARKQARSSEATKLLESFGVKTADELKALLEEGKKAADSQKTEAEKLAEKIKAAEDRAAAAEKLAADKETAMRKRLLDSEIKMLAGKVVADKDGKITRQAFRAEALDDVLVLLDRAVIEDKDGNFTGIDKALEALAKAKPYLLAEAQQNQSRSFGSPRPGEKPRQQSDQQNVDGVRIIRSL